MSDKELMYLAGLNEIEGLRGNRLDRLYEELKSFEKIWKEGEKYGQWPDKARDGLRSARRGMDLEGLSRKYGETGVEMVPFWSSEYPRLLVDVVGRPLLLYVKGEKTVLGKAMIAVVGSRRAGVKSLVNTEMVVKSLLNANVPVTSGLALGVDEKAHRVALGNNGETVAVLAHGLDQVYPKSNERLAMDIVKWGGVLVSEMPLGVTPKPYFFPMRNRLIVGMSVGVVVVECEPESGSMTSANHAAEMGRTVWVVRGSAGTDLLLQEGASEWSFS